VAAALEAGAAEVIVCDTHHGGGNIRLPDMLADPRVTYHVRSRAIRDGKSRWMPDLDENVYGLMLMGHHAKAGTEGAFLPHCWSLDWADFQINGESIGEIGIESCYAGYWDIPLILVHGDEAGCREAESQFPGVVTAAVKRAESHDRCSGLDAEAARQLTARKVAEAIARPRTERPAPYKPSLPMRVTVRMTSPAAAEAVIAKSGARRLDEVTVEQIVERQCDVVKWIANAGLD
jgi:D-amino peptidase